MAYDTFAQNIQAQYKHGENMRKMQIGDHSIN